MTEEGRMRAASLEAIDAQAMRYAVEIKSEEDYTRAWNATLRDPEGRAALELSGARQRFVDDDRA